MKTALAAVTISTLAAVLFGLAGCAGKTSETAEPAETADGGRGYIRPPNVPDTLPDATSTAVTVDRYKMDVAERIVQVNSTKVYTTRPQALLRSVVVVKYVVDANGNLLRSEIVRSNKDRVTEATAMATLKNTAPFPKPAPELMRNNRIELHESWLFNNDGRFQLRSIALPQMDQ